MTDLPADPPAFHAFVAGGIGLPELVHVEAGWMATPRLDVAARFGWVLFNPEVGLEVDGFLLGTATGRPPRHALLLSAQGMVNPTAPFGLASGGERIGAYAGAYAGYAMQAESGFLFRASVGVLLYDDAGFAAGPNGVLDAGWAF